VLLGDPRRGSSFGKQRVRRDNLEEARLESGDSIVEVQRVREYRPDQPGINERRGVTTKDLRVASELLRNDRPNLVPVKQRSREPRLLWHPDVREVKGSIRHRQLMSHERVSEASLLVLARWPYCDPADRDRHGASSVAELMRRLRAGRLDVRRRSAPHALPPSHDALIVWPAP
jgi:hypothetical protein